LPLDSGIGYDSKGGYGTAVAPGLVFNTFSDETILHATAVVDLTRGRVVKLNPSGLNLRLISYVY
jgi:hypothetical protein